MFFLIGGLLTTVVPPMLDKSWAKPAAGLKDHATLAKGGDAEAARIMKGRAIYVREGCWYCHTQQTRTLEADTKRSGWNGVKSPVSTPDEFVYDQPHMFGTQADGAGPLARRAASTTRSGTAPTSAIRADLVPGSVMPPFPWIATSPDELEALVAYVQTLGRVKDWRPDQDYEQ